MLRKGAFIAARGQSARLSGRDVLRAREFSDGSRVWPAAGTRRQGTAQASGGTPTISGTVTDARGVNLQGVSDRHTLLKVRTSEGRQVVVDVGAEASAKSLGLKKGDVVAAKGTMGRINGKPVLFARQVAQVMAVDRSNSAIKAGDASVDAHSTSASTISLQTWS